MYACIVDVGVTGGIRGYLRGRPGPRFTGVSMAGAGWAAATGWMDCIIAGADLRGRPGSLLKGAELALDVVAALDE